MCELVNIARNSVFTDFGNAIATTIIEFVRVGFHRHDFYIDFDYLKIDYCPKCALFYC